MSCVHRSPVVTLIVVAGFVASCAKPTPSTAPLVPTPGKRVEVRRGMVSASSADATAAGLAMLQRGGNAIDATVATAFALSGSASPHAGLAPVRPMNSMTPARRSFACQIVAIPYPPIPV